jgi:hypothetical protein
VRTGEALADALRECSLTEDERAVVVAQLAAWQRRDDVHPSVAALSLADRAAVAGSLGDGRDLSPEERRELIRAREAVIDPRDAFLARRSG